MGEYAKTHQRIAQLKAKKEQLLKELEELQERIADIEEEIADCEGYLLELEWIDNHNDPDWIPGTRLD